MKKNIYLIGLALISFAASAQNFYNFSKNSATYQDLSQATVISNGAYWNSSSFFIVGSTPFPISVYNHEFTGLDFIQGKFVLFDESENQHVYFVPVVTYLIDRNFSLNGAGLSTISYKVEGTAGNRILKLEIKNAGLESEIDPQNPTTSTSTLYLNYQIWLYEVDDAIEYHFGPNNITVATQLNDQAENYSQFYAIIQGQNEFGFLNSVVNGSLVNPSYSEDYDLETLPSSFDGIIPEGTVFRFAVNTLSTKDKEKVEFSMYPNPTSNILNLTFAEQVDKNYSVYDLLGREVLNGQFENADKAQISVENLQTGTYVLRIGGTTKKFIKK